MDSLSLPPALQDELRSLEEQFKVDTTKLKKISKRFEEELQEGLRKDGANIVGHDTTYTM